MNLNIYIYKYIEIYTMRRMASKSTWGRSSSARCCRPWHTSTGAASCIGT